MSRELRAREKSSPDIYESIRVRWGARRDGQGEKPSSPLALAQQPVDQGHELLLLVDGQLAVEAL